MKYKRAVDNGLVSQRTNSRNVPIGEERGETDVFAGYAQIVLQIWPKFQLTNSPGGAPLYKPHKYVPPQRVFAPF